MAVASANRGVLGGFASDDDVELESVVETEVADIVRAGVRFRAVGRFFPSRPMVGDNGSPSKLSVFFLCYNSFCFFSLARICNRTNKGRKRPVFASSRQALHGRTRMKRSTEAVGKLWKSRREPREGLVDMRPAGRRKKDPGTEAPLGIVMVLNSRSAHSPDGLTKVRTGRDPLLHGGRERVVRSSRFEGHLHRTGGSGRAGWTEPLIGRKG